MKKIKTQPVAVKSLRKQDDQVSASRETVKEKTSAFSGDQNASRGKPSAKADAKPTTVSHAGDKGIVGKLQKFEEIHRNKEREEKFEGIILPDELDTAVARPSRSEDEDEVRSSIVSQILASVRGDVGQNPPVLTGVAVKKGERPRKSSPPPVAARAANKHSSKVKKVQIDTTDTEISDSTSNSQNNPKIFSNNSKPTKPPRTNPVLSLQDQSSSEELKSARHSMSDENRTGSDSVSSDSNSHRSVSLKPDPVSVHKPMPRIDSSTREDSVRCTDQRIDQKDNPSLCPASNTRGLSTCAVELADSGEPQRNGARNNDNVLSERRVTSPHTLVNERHKEVEPASDNRDTSSEKIEDVEKSTRPTSCKSRAIIEPSGQRISRDLLDNAPLSVTSGEAIRTEFPQSFSADSGIGSPTSYSCAIGREGERGGLRCDVSPDEASLSPATKGKNEITSTPITPLDSQTAPERNGDTIYLRVPESSRAHRTSGNTAAPQTLSAAKPSAVQTCEKIESEKQGESPTVCTEISQSDSPHLPVASSPLPPFPQSIERTTEISKDSDKAELDLEISTPSSTTHHHTSPTAPHAFQRDEQDAELKSKLVEAENGNTDGKAGKESAEKGVSSPSNGDLSPDTPTPDNQGSKGVSSPSNGDLSPDTNTRQPRV